MCGGCCTTPMKAFIDSRATRQATHLTRTRQGANAGEIFVELGLAIKKPSPFPHTFLVELANTPAARHAKRTNSRITRTDLARRIGWRSILNQAYGTSFILYYTCKNVQIFRAGN